MTDEIQKEVIGEIQSTSDIKENFNKQHNLGINLKYDNTNIWVNFFDNPENLENLKKQLQGGVKARINYVQKGKWNNGKTIEVLDDNAATHPPISKIKMNTLEKTDPPKSPKKKEKFKTADKITQLDEIVSNVAQLGMKCEEAWTQAHDRPPKTEGEYAVINTWTIESSKQLSRPNLRCKI